MENTDCTTRNDDKESLLRFLQDADCLDSLSKWTNEFNIFDVLGVSRAEIRHSNMLGWLLDPNENHGLGDSFLYGIISKISQNIGTDNALHFLSSDLYTFNVRREWNHIDILLVSNHSKLVLAIENKVGSHEHNSHGISSDNSWRDAKGIPLRQVEPILQRTLLSGSVLSLLSRHC